MIEEQGTATERNGESERERESGMEIAHVHVCGRDEVKQTESQSRRETSD